MLLSQTCFLNRLTLHARATSVFCGPLPLQRFCQACTEKSSITGYTQYQVRARRFSSSAARRDEPDFAVFRFTLGIPGFEDALIPRVVGILGLCLLIANNLLSSSLSSASQVISTARKAFTVSKDVHLRVSTLQGRAEVLGGVLAGLCMLVPSIDQQLQDAAPGRGRKLTGKQIAGAAQVFHLAESLSDEQKQEFAWASYALLKNTNIVGLLVWSGDCVLLARGALNTSIAAGDKPRQALNKVVESFDFSTLSAATIYCQDPASLNRLGPKLLGFMPSGAQSLFIQEIAGDSQQSYSGLIMWSDVPRALSLRDRKWAQALAAKLAGFL